MIHVIRNDMPEWYETAAHANKGSVPAKHTMETRYASVHASEWKWAGYDFDYEISNTGTLAELQSQVDTIHNNIFSTKIKAI